MQLPPGHYGRSNGDSQMETITLFADRIETEIDGLLCIEFLADETAEVELLFIEA